MSQFRCDPTWFESRSTAVTVPDARFFTGSLGQTAMEAKEVTTSDQMDNPLQRIKKSRAREFHLTREYGASLDVMEALAKNQAITTLDLTDCQVRLCHSNFWRL